MRMLLLIICEHSESASEGVIADVLYLYRAAVFQLHDVDGEVHSLAVLVELDVSGQTVRSHLNAQNIGLTLKVFEML